MALEIKDLVKEYGTQRAVDSISFSVGKGEIVGFLGPNGAGKSTTMKIITGYLAPTSGTVEVCGFNVQSDPIEVKKRVGYLPEKNNLYTDMYIREFLFFAGEMQNVPATLLKDKVEEMIHLTGLTPERHKKIGALSRGYQQRVGLAQALIHNPEVLILDEPTTGLDPDQVVEIRRLIKEIGKTRTVVFSSHSMNDVQELCERIVFIRSGKIVANDQTDRLSETVVPVNRVVVVFAHTVDEDILKGIKGVVNVTKKGEATYHLTTEQGTDVRPEVFRCAGEKGWSLLELRQEENSMENVFRNLARSGEVSNTPKKK